MFIRKLRAFSMRRRFHSFSLRTQLSVIALIVTLIPLIVITIVSNAAIHSALVDVANESLASAATQTATNLDGFIQANLDAVRTESQLPDFGDLLDQHAQPRAANGEPAINSAKLATIMRALSRRDQIYIKSYALLDTNGIDVLDTQASDIGIDQSRQDYFSSPLNTGLPYVSPIQFSPETDQASLYFSAPVRNNHEKIVGALVIRYDASVLQQIVADTNGLAGKESFAILLDENHLRLADGANSHLVLKTVAPLESQPVARLQAANRLPRKPADQLSTNLLTFDQALTNTVARPFFRAELHTDETTQEAVAVKTLTAKPWIVAFAQPEAVFLKPVYEQGRGSLFIGSIIVLLIVVAVAGGTRLVTGPILRLIGVAEKVSAGDFRAQARVERMDEIGALALAFNTMTRQLRQTMDELTERGEKLRQVNETLAAAKARLQHLLTVSPTVLYSFEPWGDFATTFVSENVETQLGYKPSEFTGDPNFWKTRVHPDDAPRVTQLEELFEHGSTVNEYRFLHKDGAYRWIREDLQLIQDADGSPREIVGSWINITKRKRAEEEIRKRNQELTTLNQIGQSLNKLAAPSEILETIFTMVGHVLDNRDLYIALYDETTQFISFPLTTMRGERCAAGGRPFGNGITEYVIRTNTPLLVKRDLMGALAERGINMIGTQSQSFLAVPMRSGDKVIGVIALQDYEKENVYDEHHLELLTTIAAQAATALENARLYEQAQKEIAERKRGEAELKLRADEFAALYETTRALDQLQDLDTLLQTIAERAIHLLHATGGGMYIYDAIRGDLEVKVSTHPSIPIGTRLKMGEGMAGRVAQTRQPLVVEDYRTWEYRSPKYEGTPLTGVVEVPMLFGGELVGVLVVEEIGDSPHKFTDADARLLSLFAGQASSAVHNARLLAETEQRAEELSGLYDVTRDLATQYDLSTLLQTTVDRASMLLATQGAFLYLYDPAQHNLKLQLVKGAAVPLGTRLELGEGMAGRVAQSREPLVVDDYNTWDRRSSKYAGIAFSAVLEVPMHYAGELIGVLAVNEIGPTNRKFTAADTRLLSLFAGQAASAVHNARLFDETLQRTADLTQANLELRREITERERAQAALQETTEKYRGLVESMDSAISIVTPDGKFLYANKYLAQRMGLELDQVIGKTMFDLFPEPAARHQLDLIRAVIASDKGFFNEEENVLRGKPSWNRVSIQPIHDANGKAVQVIVNLVDITRIKEAHKVLEEMNRTLEQRVAERTVQLEQSLHEKEALLKEVHHRVKNNLQVISSMLNLQMGAMTDPQLVQLAQNSQSRIDSIALIHEKLYRSTDLSRIDFRDYLDDLTTSLYSMYRPAGGVHLEKDLPEVYFGIDTAIPLGLLVNELVSNSFKYAFSHSDAQDHRIYLALQAKPDGEYTLIVGDNGVGMPAGLDYRHTTSLGLQLVVTLVEQVGGTIELDAEHGTEYRITFREVKYKPR